MPVFYTLRAFVYEGYAIERQQSEQRPSDEKRLARVLHGENDGLRMCEHEHHRWGVKLPMRGLTGLEIARQTCHNPRSVDTYLKAFDSVLILYLYGLTPSLMASVLHCRESLVHEYLDLIADYLKDRQEMRAYLSGHRVAVPVEGVP